MTSKIVPIILTSCFLFSCSFGQDTIMHSHDVKQGEALPMAGMRTVNVNILDKELREITNEAQSIETQMEVLLERLNKLRDGIAGYNATHIETLSHEVTATADPAMDKPKAILPVPERPSPSAKKVTAKPKPVVKDAKPAQTAPKTDATGQGVNKVRVGVHKDKTRMVFDVAGSTQHTMNFDQEAGVVTMTFPETKWSTDKSKTYTLEQISGFEAKETGQGTIIAIAVRNASDVKAMSLTNPNRLVLDVLK